MEYWTELCAKHTDIIFLRGFLEATDFVAHNLKMSSDIETSIAHIHEPHSRQQLYSKLYWKNIFFLMNFSVTFVCSSCACVGFVSSSATVQKRRLEAKYKRVSLSLSRAEPVTGTGCNLPLSSQLGSALVCCDTKFDKAQEGWVDFVVSARLAPSHHLQKRNHINITMQVFPFILRLLSVFINFMV